MTRMTLVQIRTRISTMRTNDITGRLIKGTRVEVAGKSEQSEQFVLTESLFGEESLERIDNFQLGKS